MQVLDKIRVDELDVKQTENITLLAQNCRILKTNTKCQKERHGEAELEKIEMDCIQASMKKYWVDICLVYFSFIYIAYTSY